MLEIRTMASRDRQAWDLLWDGYLRFYRTELPDQVTETTWNRLLDPTQEPHGLVAIRDGQLCGFAHYLFHRSTWALGTYCYLEDLFVADAVRGAGVGRALIEAVYAAADGVGSSRVYWNTEETNIVAQRLYDGIASKAPFVQFRR